MKNKWLIIWVYVALALVTTYDCPAKEKRPEQEQGVRQHLEHQDEQSKEIGRIVSKRRREIENSYMNRILELRLRAAAEIRLLEVAEIPKPNWAEIHEWADFAEAVLQINGYECESYGPFKSAAETSAQRLAIALSRIAKRKSDILNKAEMEAQNLKNQKEYTLTVELEELEKPLKENTPTTKAKTTQGQVAGIFYSPEKPSAVVDSNIVHEGDKIHGAAVVKIHKDNVIFEKNGIKWKQAVRQMPETYWK